MVSQQVEPKHLTPLREGFPSATLFWRLQISETITSPVQIASMSIDFPKEEEAIIARWRELKAFERQVREPV